MKLTNREQQILDYVRKEAGVFHRAAEGHYMSDAARNKYRGMAEALDRLAGEILDGEHRQEFNSTERGLGITSR